MLIPTLLSFLLLIPVPVHAQTIHIISAPSIYELPLGTSTVAFLIKKAALENNIDDTRLLTTLECESQGFQNIQSKIPNKHGPNGFENSWGVAQIYLPAHPEIRREQAMNMVWAIKWATSEFVAGREREFSCYNILYP